MSISYQNYRDDSKFSDIHVWTNIAGPTQTVPRLNAPIRKHTCALSVAYGLQQAFYDEGYVYDVHTLSVMNFTGCVFMEQNRTKYVPDLV